jgi:hypothetical protein
MAFGKKSPSDELAELFHKRKLREESERMLAEWRAGGGKPSATVDQKEITHKPASDYRPPRKEPFTPEENAKPPVKTLIRGKP